MSSSITTSAATSTSTTTSLASSIAASQPAAFKIVGVCLAVGSGLLIGASFVIKKKGLLRAMAKSGDTDGEGHAYLKNWVWWIGMGMMIVGEICNFAAFAFTEAILVTPLGALSVVVCALLSTFFLPGETLTFFGWIGCSLVILGAVILALNAPEQQSVNQIANLMSLWLSPGFLVWAGISIIASLILAFAIGPKYSQKTMFVDIGICSLIGGLSVSTLQGVGACILESIRGDNQMKHWFIYFLMGFTVLTLLTEINFLNKALAKFNTSMVTPTYYIMFTTATLISSFILYQGLKASAVSLVTMVMGFLVTCLGITLLQMSKVDPKKFANLDRRSTMLMTAARYPTEDVEKHEAMANEEPGMDALRGGFGTIGSIMRVRRMSNASQLARRASTADALARLGGVRHDSTIGPHDVPERGTMEDFPRYSLQDAPMPNDAMERIQLHSPAMTSPLPPTHQSHLKFGEQDVVHQYNITGPHTAIHTSRPHASPGPHGGPPSPGGLAAPIPPFLAGRSQSDGSSIRSYPSPHDSPGHPKPFFSFRGRQDEDRTPTGQTRFPSAPSIEESPEEEFPFQEGSSRHHGIGNLFAKKAKSREELRSPQSKTKEYPQAKGVVAEDKDERAALVRDSRPSEDTYQSSQSSEGSPVEPEFGRAVIGQVKRLPFVPELGPTYPPSR